MAIVIDNIYTKGISGRVGDSLLYKHYGNKTVVTAFPRLSTLAPSARQLAQRKKFALAVLKTRQWLPQKAQKQFLQGLKNKWNSLSAYHAGIRYHMTLPAETATHTTGSQALTQMPVQGYAPTKQPLPANNPTSNPHTDPPHL